MTEIEAIRQRHSVRNYQPRPVEAAAADEVRALIEEVNREGRLHFQWIGESGRTFSRLLNRAMGLSTAPSVIACVGPDDDGLEERVGYYGEKLVLAAQRLGLRTCWAGTFSKNQVPAQIGPGERLVIVIAVGYGVTDGKVRKSKSAAQVSDAPGERPAWFDRGVELALLAPTAINQQQFHISLQEDGTVTFRDQGGPFSRVDLGIVKYHFEIGAREAREE